MGPPRFRCATLIW
ncbi:hypothetical protein LINPERPRIM_LOCUS32281 [Linum perenne]